MHTVRMTAAKLQIETMRMQRELDEKNAVALAKEETTLGWHDAKTDPPKYYKNVLLLIHIWYEVEGKKYDKEYMVEGYYHSDNVYCSWIGDMMEEQETCLAWRELPEKPKRPIGSIIKECDKKIPEKPKGHPLRIIQEGEIHICSKCGSSIKTRWFGLKKLGCIQPECEDYYDNP
jgi:hypothetical protein